MNVRLQHVPVAQKAQLREMLSGYLRELQQFGDVDLEYRFFDTYWTQDDRWPYFIETPQGRAGFILVNTFSESGEYTDRAVAEFCVLERFRRAGVGRRAFQELLKMHHGVWEFGVMRHNKVADAFWRNTLTNSAGDVRRMADEEGVIYQCVTAPE